MPVMFRAALISMFMTSTALADTWTVDDDGKADFNNIQAAVDAASDGDEIIVMPGTYTGSGQNVVEILNKTLSIRGSSLNNGVVIDGEGTRRGVLYEGYGGGTLDGFVIQNCHSNFGGGIYTSGIYASPDIYNCTFQNNYASKWGGGLYIGGSNIIQNCLIKNNTTGAGGGGIFFGGTSSNNQTLILDCTITENRIEQGGYGGGGLMIQDSTNFTIKHSTIENNLGYQDGILISGGYGLEIDNCWLKYNDIYNYGQPMAIHATYFCSSSIATGQWTDEGGNVPLNQPCGDEDGDWIPDQIDNCSLPNESQIDCNQNNVGDVCDLADGTSTDWDGNFIPDDCQEDCNDNSYPDYWELEEGISADCNGNLVPDDCDILNGFSSDCNQNNVPDTCDLDIGTSQDCNDNKIPDECDITSGLSNDCDGNGIPDLCDIDDGTYEDCNNDGIPNICDIDCNENNISDFCDIINESSNDCNQNNIPDECDMSSGLANDCNENSIPDVCDISAGYSSDNNQDNIPDECQCFGDVNNDWNINVSDVLIVIASWGQDGGLGDTTDDGIVDVADILLVISNWGECE